MDETPNILELEGIVKEFSSVRVLDRVSMSIRQGEIMMWSTLSGHRKGGIIFFIITRG